MSDRHWNGSAAGRRAIPEEVLVGHRCAAAEEWNQWCAELEGHGVASGENVGRERVAILHDELREIVIEVGCLFGGDFAEVADIGIVGEDSPFAHLPWLVEQVVGAELGQGAFVGLATRIGTGRGELIGEPLKSVVELGAEGHPAQIEPFQSPLAYLVTGVLRHAIFQDDREGEFAADAVDIIGRIGIGQWIWVRGAGI